jgi:hypothetical protein
MRIQSSSGIFSNGFGSKIPTLFTRISVVGTASASFSHPAAFDTSAATPFRCAPGCSRPICAIAAFTRFSVRPFTITEAPSAASRFAIANPIPAVDPVTTARFPFSSRSIGQSMLRAVLKSRKFGMERQKCKCENRGEHYR